MSKEIVNVRAALERVLFAEYLELRLFVPAEKRKATSLRFGRWLRLLPRIGNHIHIKSLAANKPGHDIEECLLSEHIIRPTLGVLNKNNGQASMLEPFQRLLR